MHYLSVVLLLRLVCGRAEPKTQKINYCCEVIGEFKIFGGAHISSLMATTLATLLIPMKKFIQSGRVHSAIGFFRAALPG